MAFRLKRAAWSSYRCKRHTPGQHSAFIEFKRASAKFRRVTKLAQAHSWRSYVSTISTDTPFASVWRRIQKISGKHPPLVAPVLTLPEGEIAEPIHVATELGSHFSRISSGSHLPLEFLALKSTCELTSLTFTLSSSSSYNSSFTLSELIYALRHCRNTSAGPDDIHYQMLRHLSTTTTSFLLNLFNRIWLSGDFPPQWREALILPFPKPGTSGSSPQNYRPIALTSCICKVLKG